jgi:phenylalanyl-tRNA synthetase beta chain
MKFTLSWLKDHLQTDASVETIADTLTAIGLEVEGIEDKAGALTAFSVAEIVSAEPHPDADRLRVCRVNIGPASSSAAVGQDRIIQVVCGAPNARAGLKAVFAPSGTYIPGSDMTLKVVKIRGVESHGMLCSGAELELSDEHDGIIELKPDAEPGSSAADALGLNDPVFDVAITPNRGDCTSVYGIARDLAAAGLGTLKDGSVVPVKGGFASAIATALEFPEDKKDACPIFAGRLVRGVKNGPSPEWLQNRLRAIGLRPISALVDVTNFISQDRGRPLHVFDAAKLQGNLRARLARKGETLLALDESDYTLDEEMTVIADDAAARGIAGVMGGMQSGCSETTRDVFIESAYFDPLRTARTGRTLGIVSDARYRFERGVDPDFVVGGLELATKLILEFCGGEASEISVAGAVPDWKRVIAFDPATVARLAGLSLPRDEIVGILKRLGFGVESEGMLRVTPPSWRGDIHGAADLVEEIVRIKGLDFIESVPMSRESGPAGAILTPAQRQTSIARRALAAAGLNECVHLSFVPREHAALFGGGDEARQLENPISADLDALRPSLIPSLLAAAARNQARGVSHLSLFEIGAQFSSGKPGDQVNVAAGLRAGDPPRHWIKGARIDAFTAKADMLSALEAAWGQAVNIPASAIAPAWYHPGRSGALGLGSKPLAYFGELHPRVLAGFDIKGPAAAFEIFLDALPEPKARAGKTRGALEASDFPAVERDFAFVIDSSVTAEAVIRAAKSVDRQLIENVGVFDLYEGKGIKAGQKSLAISVRLQPMDKTLTEPEIESVAKEIIAAVTKATGGSLRS